MRKLEVGVPLRFMRAFSNLPVTEENGTLHTKLARIGCDNYESTLMEMGVKRTEDLSILCELDLIAKDIPLVQARKIVGIASSSDQEQEHVLPLSTAQKAMVHLNDFGIYRADRSYKSILISSILGGSFISFGASMYILLGGGTPMLQESLPGLHAVASALIFPIGLSSIVLTQTDMLTSSMMYATLPFTSGDKRKSTTEKAENLAKLWGTNFVGNFIGCLGFACLASTLFINDPFSSFAQAIAIKKTSYLATGTTMTAFGKAVGANWLVCLAIFQAATATTSPGKMAALWLPITTFVALGLEHSVANMFLIPLGMFCGADISVNEFLVGNLLPVGLGNAFGGSVFVSLLHWQYLMKK